MNKGPAQAVYSLHTGTVSDGLKAAERTGHLPSPPAVTLPDKVERQASRRTRQVHPTGSSGAGVGAGGTSGADRARPRSTLPHGHRAQEQPCTLWGHKQAWCCWSRPSLLKQPDPQTKPTRQCLSGHQTPVTKGYGDRHSQGSPRPPRCRESTQERLVEEGAPAAPEDPEGQRTRTEHEGTLQPAPRRAPPEHERLERASRRDWQEQRSEVTGPRNGPHRPGWKPPTHAGHGAACTERSCLQKRMGPTVPDCPRLGSSLAKHQSKT